MIYADTSFLLPLYLLDKHSADAQQRMRIRPALFLTPFQRAELVNAIFQSVFRTRISEQEAQLVLKDFEQDSHSGLWLNASVSEMAFTRCETLARKHVSTLGVRTLDSLHVACALELGAKEFWTFDQRQARLAEAEGLQIN